MTQAREEALSNPRLWRAVRRMARRLSWQMWWLAMLGWLETSGPWSRWASCRLSELEHGLRCLLVIALQGKASGLLADRKARPEASSPDPTHDDETPRTRRPGERFALSAADLVRRLGVVDERARLCLPFDHSRGSAPVCGGVRSRSATADEKVWETFSRRRTPEGQAPERGEGGKQAQLRDNTPALLARMKALANALADPDPVMARLARRLAAMGLRVMRVTMRPANRDVWAQGLPLVHLAAAPAPTICDSS